MTTTALSQSEEARLQVLIGQVEEGQRELDRGAVRIGNALIEIRESKLYRTYGTLEEFGRSRFGYERRRLYGLINFAEVRKTLSDANFSQLPECERHARPLSGLPPEQQVEAWGRVTETTTTPTGPIVEAAVAEVQAEQGDLVVGQSLTVTDPSAPHAGEKVEVKEFRGPSVAICKTPSGGDFPYMRSELEGADKPAATGTRPAVPQVQAHEVLSLRLQLAEARILILEELLSRAIEWLPIPLKEEVGAALDLRATPETALSLQRGG